MRDHNAGRLALLDGGDRRRVGAGRAPGPSAGAGPDFQRAAGHLAVLPQMITDFREPLIWVLFEGNVVVNGNTEDVEDHTQLTWLPWRASCPKIYRVRGIDLKGLRGDWRDDIS